MTQAQGNPTEATLAYLAGIIDGEGHVSIAKLKGRKNQKSPAHQPRMAVKMCTPEAIDLMYATFGGYVYWSGSRYPNSRPTFTWEMNGRERVVKILEQLFPYLRTKRVMAEVIFEFNRAWINGKFKGSHKKGRTIGTAELTRREDLYIRIKQLNARGARASTERRDPERGSDSQDSQETVREKSEEVSPPDFVRLH